MTESSIPAGSRQSKDLTEIPVPRGNEIGKGPEDRRESQFRAEGSVGYTEEHHQNGESGRTGPKEDQGRRIDSSQGDFSSTGT